MVFVAPLVSHAKDTYPKLANYYLKYYSNIRPEDYESLKKWDLVIVQNDISTFHPSFLNEYKTRRPDGILLAYVYSAMAVPLPQGLYNDIEAANLWLRDANGSKLEVGPNIYAVNLSKDSWQSMNVDFVGRKLQEGPWDGVMYDVVDASINHFSGSGIDINADGQTDSSSFVNSLWQRGMVSLFSKTRAAYPNSYILMNGNSLPSYQAATNGRIFENFPTPWEGNGSWQASMTQYLKLLPPLNRAPKISVINGSTNNRGNMSSYRLMRFGLTSALLGDGYYSFDFGDQKHEQTWWYDEYDVQLGRAENTYFNLLDSGNNTIKPGLWRRDFENGVSIVNSTAKDQLFIFKREQFEKIQGTQDRNFNDGTKVNYIRLAPNDGIIMRKVKQDVFGAPFYNGNFLRVFNNKGQQLRNGFFAYRADASPNSLVLYEDFDSDGGRDRASVKNGKLIINRSGKSTVTISPFGTNFKGELVFAAYDFNKDGNKEIVVGPAAGGPQIKIYAASGKQLTPGFFAFDKNFRGGVTVSAGDINNDGKGEIVVAPGKGLPGTVKIFNEQGKLLGSFLAYDKNFRGGVNLAIGDVDNDGKNELVTGAASGGPHVRIFDYAGRLKGQFMAFDPKSGGVSVIVSDTDGDGKFELLAGTANF
jgi:hypothetical protein